MRAVNNVNDGVGATGQELANGFMGGILFTDASC